MIHQKRIFIIVLVLLVCCPVYALAIPAFPGAAGMGAETVGGRGGTVYIVSNLNDSGAGSFRNAVTASGPRIVVFSVSGYINLASLLKIESPYLTVAGQTSPGGICITGYPVRILTHDVIVTHMRFRVGSHRSRDYETYGESLYIGDGYNIVIDHCSMSWGTDETVQIGTYWGGIYNVTISWSMIYEGLQDPHGESNHGYGLFMGCQDDGDVLRATIHHSYLAHHRDRTPEIRDDAVVDFRNNVVYDWYHTLGVKVHNSVGNNPQVNVVHNYMKPGVNTNDCYPTGNAGEITSHFGGSVTGTLYVEGNLGCMRDSQEDDEWAVVKDWSGDLLDRGWQKSTPYAMPGTPVTTTTMSYAYAQEILESVGATKPFRDSADARVVSEFKNGTGDFVGDVTYPAGFPTLSTGIAPTDSDSDGMGDSWETSRGLNVGSNDSAADDDGDGYTNIEEYLHYLSGLSGGPQLPKPSPPENLRVVN